MFKTWQIFVFSLVPLALVFAGVIIGSYHGSDSRQEVFPAQAAPDTSAAVASGTVGPGSSASAAPGTLTLVAKNLAYDKRSLGALPNSQVTLVLDNQDAGVLHNFALYTNRNATTKIFVGDLSTGIAKATYTFKSPGPGNYFFRCDVHPDQMTGTFAVK